VTQYVHRVLAVAGIGVLALHVGTILADAYAHVGVTGAVVPFTSGYRATWVGLGTLAGYLLLLTAATGLARGRLATSARAVRSWRVVHGLGYAAWALALYHGYRSGTDSSTGWVRWTYVACTGAGFGALAWRLAVQAQPRPLLRRPRRGVTA
jgi:sulfoxide reductase heme-binding subunit YedZ